DKNNNKEIDLDNYINYTWTLDKCNKQKQKCECGEKFKCDVKNGYVISNVNFKLINSDLQHDMKNCILVCETCK
ncbi:hypothetical protein OFL77_27895, partial [Escherichia coli]|uniref:hypothetical protein n=1 Tax=Escherichia coli TaxID=562 RepID=UPI0021DF487C